MSDDPEIRFACHDCDVEWMAPAAASTECWCCGLAAPPRLGTASRPGAVERPDASVSVSTSWASHPDTPRGGLGGRVSERARLTRWGTNVQRCLAMGLPDPRSAAS